MSTKDRKYQQALETQLEAAHADLKSAKVEHSHACLIAAQNPNNTEAAEAVEALEAEIVTHQRKIARLEAAVVARAAQVQCDQTANIKQQAAQLRKDAARLDAEIGTVTSRLASKIEDLAPLLARLAQATTEHRATIGDALRAFPFAERHAHWPANHNVDAGIAPADAILAALHRCGIFTNQVTGRVVRPAHVRVEADRSEALFKQHTQAVAAAIDAAESKRLAVQQQ